MANRGATPISATTNAGMLRLALRDTVGVPLSPAETGYLSYGWFSDADLAVFLTLGRNSVIRAAGEAYMAMAHELALQSASATSADMRADNTKRAEQMTKLAEERFKQADLADEAAVAADFYAELVDPLRQDDPYPRAGSSLVLDADGYLVNG